MMTIKLEDTFVHPPMLEKQHAVRQPGGTAVCRLVWHTGSQTFKGNSALSSWFHLAAASAPYPAIFADFNKICSDFLRFCRKMPKHEISRFQFDFHHDYTGDLFNFRLNFRFNFQLFSPSRPPAANRENPLCATSKLRRTL